MKIIYLSGPYSGKDYNAIEANIQRAEAWAIHLWNKGYGVFCPHLNTRHFEVKVAEAEQADYLEFDLRIVAVCDAMLMLPGWTGSLGACKERARARALGRPVFEMPSELDDWRDGER